METELAETRTKRFLIVGLLFLFYIVVLLFLNQNFREWTLEEHIGEWARFLGRLVGSYYIISFIGYIRKKRKTHQSIIINMTIALTLSILMEILQKSNQAS